jgi:hypothetical protein
MARLVTLQTFPERTDALFLRSFLEAQGFFVVVADEAIVGQDWLAALAIGGVRVQVLDTQVDDILATLEEAELLHFAASRERTPAAPDVRLPLARKRNPAAPDVRLPLARKRNPARPWFAYGLVACLALSAGAPVLVDVLRLFVGPPAVTVGLVSVAAGLVLGIVSMFLPLFRTRHAAAPEVESDRPDEVPVWKAEALPPLPGAAEVRGFLARNAALLLFLAMLALLLGGPVVRVLRGGP